MIKEIRKFVLEAVDHNNKEGVKAAKSGTSHECSFYAGCAEAYEYVLKLLDRFSDEKGGKK